jgi:hypothetical protein
MSVGNLNEVRVQSAREFDAWMTRNSQNHHKIRVIIFASAVCVPSVSYIALGEVAQKWGWTFDPNFEKAELRFVNQQAS